MKLSEFKKQLNEVKELNFLLPDGTKVPEHFHVTEVGQITKNFIDCGGTVRSEQAVNFQFWEASDYDHRLAPERLKKIIALSEKALEIADAEIEVEYQTSTIGKYGIEFNGREFTLTSKSTNCLASDSCGTKEKSKVSLTELSNQGNSCCTPGGGCC